MLIAQLSQGTVHSTELDDTWWMMLDNVLKERSELHQMQYVHLPEVVAQVRTKYDAQWLKSKRALQEEVLEEGVIPLRSQGICIGFRCWTSGAYLLLTIAKHGFNTLPEKLFQKCVELNSDGHNAYVRMCAKLVL